MSFFQMQGRTPYEVLIIRSIEFYNQMFFLNDTCHQLAVFHQTNLHLSIHYMSTPNYAINALDVKINVEFINMGHSNCLVRVQKNEGLRPMVFPRHLQETSNPHLTSSLAQGQN